MSNRKSVQNNNFVLPPTCTGCSGSGDTGTHDTSSLRLGSPTGRRSMEFWLPYCRPAWSIIRLWGCGILKPGGPHPIGTIFGNTRRWLAKVKTFRAGSLYPEFRCSCQLVHCRSTPGAGAFYTIREYVVEGTKVECVGRRHDGEGAVYLHRF